MMSLRQLSFAFVLFTTNAQIAKAQELTFDLIRAYSSARGGSMSCNNQNIQLIGVGTDLSIFFSNMNIDSPAGTPASPRTLQSVTCSVFMKVTVPQGYTLTNNSMSIVGGVVKNIGPVSSMDLMATLTRFPAQAARPLLNYKPIGPKIQIHRAFAEKQSINNALFVVPQSKNLALKDKQTICNLTTNSSVELGLYVQVTLASRRFRSDQTSILNLDDVDGKLDLGLKADECP